MVIIYIQPLALLEHVILLYCGWYPDLRWSATPFSTHSVSGHPLFPKFKPHSPSDWLSFIQSAVSSVFYYNLTSPLCVLSCLVAVNHSSLFWNQEGSLLVEINSEIWTESSTTCPSCILSGTQPIVTFEHSYLYTYHVLMFSFVIVDCFLLKNCFA